MKKFPRIKLPQNTEFVLTSDIPELIADALYPEVKFTDMPVVDLYKIPKNPVRPGSWYERLWSLFSPTYDWYRPLSAIDEQILHKIWLHLPKLAFPISREDWKPYALAFSECSNQIDFDLKEDYVEWLVEPNGHQKQFFERNNYSSNILGMWMDDMDDRKLILKCGMAEMEHIVLLRSAIKDSEIIQLSPITHIQSNVYQQFGKVPVTDFAIYAKKFEINVIVEQIDDTPCTTTSSTSTVNEDSPEKHESDPVTTEPVEKHSSTRQSESENSDWRVSAREIADELFDYDTTMKTRDSLKNYSLRTMNEMQKRRIKGPRGIIDNPATIMRDALQGDKWWANKKK